MSTISGQIQDARIILKKRKWRKNIIALSSIRKREAKLYFASPKTRGRTNKV